ncbi:MAG: stage II sporulation protein M [Chitinophagaceae bacterium]
MREAQFLKDNAEKWKQYELDVDKPADPDIYAERFIELSDDLAFAQTFYPDSKTTRYLNGLAGRFHQKIYKNKKESSSRIFEFWRYELPHLFLQYQRTLLYAFLFFIVFCFIGALSAKYDSTFLNLILGDEYVNMTKENIAMKDPFGVYKKGSQATMFFQIAINNIKVSFFAFIAGICYSVGSILLLMYNGIMLGSFEYYFFANNLGLKSILVVFLHGTLEISAIVIAGCAGLILGNSLLFPKTYSRWDSLIKAGKDGMKIVFGLIPVFITAAFIESFITRYTEMPVWLSASVLALSLFFIIYYFIWYPQLLHRRINAISKSGAAADDQKLMLWLNKKSNSEK